MLLGLKEVFSRADDYSFLHPEANVIQYYSDSALNHVRDAWSNADSNAFVIAHFGDEHVQTDMFTGYLQEILQGGSGEWRLREWFSPIRLRAPLVLSTTQAVIKAHGDMILPVE